MSRLARSALCIVLGISSAACRDAAPEAPPRASGYVEATEVRIAARVGGRVAEVHPAEGTRVAAGEPLVTLAPTEIDLALRRARAERAQAEAQLRLLEAGARQEDIRQAEAQLAAANAERVAAASEVDAARADAARFEQLVRSRAGSEKQRDDAVARRDLAEARLGAAADRARAAEAALARLAAGARPEEIEAARARVEATAAQIATFEHDRDGTAVAAPTDGIVATRLIEPGELVSPGQPLLVLVDLDHAWATAFVEEPLVPSLRIGGAATVTTDAGDRLEGRITFISPQAEFTPRNVQTSEERAKLVYRVKVTVDNRAGILKPGMPVEVVFEPGG
jgi:HlyD family secretion protein